MISANRPQSSWHLLFILVIAASARLYQLAARSIWFDESFTWRLIQFPWPEIISRTAADVHPPLYYLLLNIWAIVFGSGLFSLRGFSVAVVLGLIALSYYFVLRLSQSRLASFLAALLISLSGWHIILSQEARMYTLGALLALLSTYLIWLAASRPRSNWFLWLAYSLSAAALLYTHYYGLFTLVAHAIWFIIYLLLQTRGRLGEILHAPRFWQALVSALVAIALFLPWLPILQAQRAQVAGNFWIPPVTGWSIPDTLYRMFVGTAGPIEHWTIAGFITALLPTIILLVITIWLGLKSKSLVSKSALWLIILSGYLPFLASLIISIISRPIYQDRYLIFSYTFLAMLLALWLATLRPSIIRLSLSAAAILFLIYTAWQFHLELDFDHRPGLQAAMATIYANHPDQVLVSSSFIYFSARHYAQERMSDTGVKLYSASGSADFAHFAGGPIITDEDVVSNNFLNNLNSFWLVDTTGFGGSETTLPPEWQPVQRYSFPEIFDYQGDIIIRRFVVNR